MVAKLLINKTMTQILMVLAKAYTRAWYFFRCKVRNRSDFNCSVNNLRSQYHNNEVARLALSKTKFFSKVVLVNNDIEKSVAIKIGDIEIMYSFDKKARKSNVLLFDDTPEWAVLSAIVRMTKANHQKASVFQLSKHRKEKEDGKTKHRKSSSQSSV
tara:strand:+ start:135 stop:605 length:471 start_codon:yes stop_codon:yes gene_type:complete